MPKRVDHENGQKPPSSHSSDQLEYIADLIQELEDLARSQKLTTLAGILDLAHAEARLRSRDVASGGR